MSAANAALNAKFEAPGPGTWLLDAVHVPRPFSKFQSEVHPPNLALGFRESFRRYGLLIDTLDWRMVNGFAYFAVVPAPGDEIPARFEAAERAFASKIWRDDLTRWTNEVKPAAIRAHLELQQVDPGTLSTEDLLSHLDRCREHLQRMIRQHHSFNAPAFMLVGDFMAHAAAWTDAPLGTILAALRGAAPELAGSFPELDQLVAVIRDSAEARSILTSTDLPETILKRLRAQPDPVGAATNAYLDLVGYRLLDSLDTGEPYALEKPGTLLEGIRRAVQDGAPAASEASANEVASLRAKVPAEHREAFDEVLAEARLMSRLRDERGLYSDVWAAGITRRVILEGGSRLAAAGRLHHATHLAEGGYEEIRALLQGLDGPSADELAARARYRAKARASDAPPFLGDPPHPPPPLDGLPPGVQRAMRAIGTAIDAVFAPSSATSEVKLIRGTGASPGTYVGTARVLGGPSDFDRLRSGDVLVTATTTEAFNIVLPLLGAIVTDAGGLLSHAAIVSREYGIPGVVGCRDATSRIADGTRVEVNGSTGEVRVLSP